MRFFFLNWAKKYMKNTEVQDILLFVSKKIVKLDRCELVD